MKANNFYVRYISSSSFTGNVSYFDCSYTSYGTTYNRYITMSEKGFAIGPSYTNFNNATFSVNTDGYLVADAGGRLGKFNFGVYRTSDGNNRDLFYTEITKASGDSASHRYLVINGSGIPFSIGRTNYTDVSEGADDRLFYVDNDGDIQGKSLIVKEEIRCSGGNIQFKNAKGTIYGDLTVTKNTGVYSGGDIQAIRFSMENQGGQYPYPVSTSSVQLVLNQSNGVISVSSSSKYLKNFVRYFKDEETRSLLKINPLLFTYK